MTVADPFLIQGPALISFSGGRTSAYMLWRILQAHGGQLPPDVVVAFANTGKEREETLRFVHECGTRWGVRIRWVEYLSRKGDPAERFEDVGFNSASRNGAPLQRAIADKGFLPNAVTRFCTTLTKVETMKNLMLSLGHKHWNNAVGLRVDEMFRVFKQLARNDQGKERWTSIMPLAKANITKRDVMTFWLGPTAKFPSMDLPQGFDLGLRDYEGNCDLCFLKSRGALKTIMRENPGAADWWIAQEAAVSVTARKASGARFVTEYSYADLARDVAAQPHLFDELDPDEHDAECGLWCAGDAA